MLSKGLDEGSFAGDGWTLDRARIYNEHIGHLFLQNIFAVANQTMDALGHHAWQFTQLFAPTHKPWIGYTWMHLI